MLRLTTRALILSLCLLSICAFAQENRVVRVGVAVMQNHAGRSVPGNIERDRLVAALNQEKRDKKLHIKIQGVPLDGMTPEDVGAEAQQKNCDYVVYTTLVELQASTDATMPRPGTIQTNPNGVWNTPNNAGGMNPRSNPNNAEAGAMDPEYLATVEYRLYRAGNPTAIAGAPFSNRQAAPEEAVVSQVMSQIANRVFAEVKKGTPALTE